MRRHLWHELQRRGFTPDDSGEDWADLPIGGADVLSVPRCKIRVEWDDGTVIVHALTGNGVSLWDVRLSDNTPFNVTATVIDLAIARAVTDGADECDT
jgi:hypothetical protein